MVSYQALWRMFDPDTKYIKILHFQVKIGQSMSHEAKHYLCLELIDLLIPKIWNSEKIDICLCIEIFENLFWYDL